jgi:hypothetical protein
MLRIMVGKRARLSESASRSLIGDYDSNNLED